MPIPGEITGKRVHLLQSLFIALIRRWQMKPRLFLQLLIGCCQIACTEQLRLIDHRINDSWKTNRRHFGQALNWWKLIMTVF